MKRQWSIQSLILVCFLGCTSIREFEPSGPIARFGSTPTIDGVFEDGEWDDAEVIQVGNYEQFRLKHDKTNLYFALTHDGGNLYFNKDKGIQVLHASAQLGITEYINSGSFTQSLDKAFHYQLFGLQNESVADIKEIMADYLAENGWVASIGPLGNMAQSEWAVSFNWLGVTDLSKRFVETPRLYIFSARMRLSPEEKKALLALPLEERKNLYPPLNWPASPIPNDSLNNGLCPETIHIDPTSWPKIWIDLEGRVAAK
jgi:hypothetical protein